MKEGIIPHQVVIAVSYRVLANNNNNDNKVKVTL
jgi:hypothetical protein